MSTPTVVSLDAARRLLDSAPIDAVPGQLAVEEASAKAPAPVPPGLAEAFAARTRATEGGHQEWTGTRTASGAGRFRHRGVNYTAYQAAFILRTGRAPVGTVRPTCDVPRCCAPEHVDDRATRQRDRAALAAVKGMTHKAPSCEHDQAVHGRHRADGRRYCDACNQMPRCEHGNPGCGARPARPYPCGPRCDEHQPAHTRPFYTAA